VPLTARRRRGGAVSWEPLAEVDWSRGMVRDAPRDAIPKSGVYDSADYLLHQQGLAQKRGGTAYAGPAMTAATYADAVAFAEFPAGSKVVAIGDNGHIYTVAAGATTDLGGSTVSTVDTPKLRVGAGKNLLVIPNANGTGGPVKYDGSAAPAALGGTPAAGKYCAIYKTRVVLGGNNANPNRLFFSPTPDIESTWDTTNAWIDCDYAITGIASLHNVLLIFSQGHTERIIGSTPPPGSDMDRAPIGSIGCTDARSIVIQEGNAIFANPRGVYLTNGAGFASLTTEGLIETYWQSLFSGYDPTTWTIAAGVLRSFYFVHILDNNGALVAALMCYVPRRAWWRLTNMRGRMFATAVGAQDDLYYADRSTNRVTKLGGIFMPAAGNKADANGSSVTPSLEMRMIGQGTELKAYGDAHLTYDLQDAASDAPTLAVSVAPGVEAPTYTAVAESPLAATSGAKRRRLTVSRDTQGLSVKITQTGPSAKTELYAFEQLIRSYGYGAEGQ
jgi:hypothetical protein